MQRWKSIIFLLFFLLFVPDVARAGIFDLPGFVEPTQWSVGIEPEFILSDGVGLGFNFKPRYGINNLLNVQGIVGTGTGDRTFRLGGTLDIEFFPDIERQPGLAFPVTVLYQRRTGPDDLILTGTPMIYKTFNGQGARYTPFIGVPLGWKFEDSVFYGFTIVSLGTMIVPAGWESVRFTAEAGFNAANAYSYLSGGVTYYP
ncbi:MAG: hypothetical protein AB7F43_12080 [Bacteriovoracia bacterium]